MLNSQNNSYYTTDSNVKKRIDETDPNNVYIWTTKSKNSITDTALPIWDIVCISKVWNETLTWLRVDWIESWANVWDDRTTYNYK